MNITKDDLSSALRITLRNEIPTPMNQGSRIEYIERVMKKVLQCVGMCPDDQSWWIDHTSGSIRKRIDKIKRKICQK